MMGCLDDSDLSEFVEVDPTGRYGRYSEILGKGASKTVYRAFDEYGGMEVAWNQVKLYDILQSPEDLERLYCEIHLLKTLKHKNIMKFYSSWVDTSNRNINFVTEMFTSGTLRQYRHKHKKVNIRAVKHWCRQILNGLLYLHSHDPPVIHRDLKCDNIFVNGNQGEVKIGDLGLAAILRQSHAAHCVGTPEFMAPEVYEEEYDELVDIYSFGMCVLEMVTFEYPYSECTHPAEIYKKVTSGIKPEALFKVKDPEVRQFVEKCLTTASERLTARELLDDPFLQIEEHGSGNREVDSYDMSPRQPLLYPINSSGSSLSSGHSDEYMHKPEMENGRDYNAAGDVETSGIDLFNIQDDEYLGNVDITMKGRKKEDGSIFLRLRITDRDGRVRNIYFPFDVEADTALSVATEMVAELDIVDYEVTRISDMIDGEVSALVPRWKPGPGIEEALEDSSTALCQNCASTVSSCGSLLDYLSLKNPDGGTQQPCCIHLECASTHGRFEEVTYQAEESADCEPEQAHTVSASQTDLLVSVLQASESIHSDEKGSQSVQLVEDGRQADTNGHVDIDTGKSVEHSSSGSTKQKYWEIPYSGEQHPLPSLSDHQENAIRQELRWLKAKHRIELRDYRYHLGESMRDLHPLPDLINTECNGSLVKSFHPRMNFSFPRPHLDIKAMLTSNGYSSNDISGNCFTSHPDEEAQKGQHCEVNSGSSLESLFTAKNFYDGTYQPILRTKSLLVDAVLQSL